MCEPCTTDALLKPVRGLRMTDPNLGFKPLLAKLREQQPDLGANTKEVREALNALKAESEAAKATAAPPAAKKQGAPSPAALSLACFGCARLPSDMDDDREKHPVCPKCVKHKLLTTYWCCVDCPGNPGAWKLHAVYHKEVKKQRKDREDGGVTQQRNRETAEKAARIAAQTGSAYAKLLAGGVRYASKEDWRRAARASREAIALEPDQPAAYYNLGDALRRSGHYVEAAKQFLECKERMPVGSKYWADATVAAFDMLNILGQQECDEVAKPEWWNDEGLKALSARVVTVAPNDQPANQMRAHVLSGFSVAWEAGPRSAAELNEAATHYERTAALCTAPAGKLKFSRLAESCRSQAEAM